MTVCFVPKCIVVRGERGQRLYRGLGLEGAEETVQGVEEESRGRVEYPW